MSILNLFACLFSWINCFYIIFQSIFLSKYLSIYLSIKRSQNTIKMVLQFSRPPSYTYFWLGKPNMGTKMTSDRGIRLLPGPEWAFLPFFSCFRSLARSPVCLMPLKVSLRYLLCSGIYFQCYWPPLDPFGDFRGFKGARNEHICRFCHFLPLFALF